MNKYLFVILAVMVIGSSYAFAQKPQLATFQEQAQIIIDNKISHNATASISLLSTSNQEIKIPSEFEKKVLDDERITAIILTNEERCVLGVIDESCILVNVKRDPDWKGIIEIQDNSRAIGDLIIDDLNKIFDTQADFHSVIIHQNDESNVALETSGVISGRGAISVVYTMPMESTDSMFEKISSLLIPKVIREADGFYNVAHNLSVKQHAKMTFSMLPQESNALYQLKVSVDYPNIQFDGRVDPLSFLDISKLERSKYFAGGFYPVNSLLQVVVLSNRTEEISQVEGNILPTQIVDEEKIPLDLTVAGWIFDPDSGQKIEGKYLFGKESSVDSQSLVFTLSSYNPEEPVSVTERDDSFLVVIVIAVVAAAAAAFYLRGYRRSP